jgi:TldD protein
MIVELEKIDALAAELGRRARAAGVLSLWRAQSRSVRQILVRKGKPESSSVTSISGHGLQVVRDDGRTVLGSRDDFRPEPALELLDRLVRVAGATESLELTANPLPSLEPVRARRLRGNDEAFERIDLPAIGRRLAELERETAARVDGVNLRLSFRAELDAWRIFRSDGTDVFFSMPRCSLGVRATGAGDGARHGVSASVFHTDPELTRNDEVIRRFLRRAEKAAALARALPDAPTHPAGSFPLVIDYALAKGLAHEAFGHAAEADGYRSSVLAREGRFRRGDSVGADHVSIVDEPIEHDHAWQPYSANGLARRRVIVVERGKLSEGLSDPWSAGPGGVRLAGSARAESFRNAPLPRMSNIRIEVDAPLAAPGEFDDYGPEEVRDLLAAAGVFRRHPRVVYLSGYSGGQVNTAIGDFVFHCKAIYDLGPDGVRFHKPAIFSGSMFGALNSVREAFGPLELDAIGYCGKWGQQVPSSGGSHYFLVLDPDPTVRLGGG